MKTTVTLIVILFTLFFLNTFIQADTTWGLPEGATARLGKGIIRDIAYSPDGAQLAVATTVGIWIYDAETYEARSLIATPASNIAYSPDGSTLAGAHGGHLTLWDAVTTTRIKTLSHDRDGYTSNIHSIAYSPDGTKIAVGDNRGGLLWNVETDTLIATLDRDAYIIAIVFSPDGRTIAAASRRWGDSPLNLWSGITGTFQKRITPTDDYIWDVAYSPDGTIIACTTFNQSVVLWDVAASVPIDTLPHFSGGYSVVAYSPDGKTITVGGNFGVVSIWDANTGNRRHELREHLIHATAVSGVAYSPDSQTVASGCEDGTVRFWNTATGALKHTITGHSNAIHTLAYSPDGNTLAVGGDDSVRTAGLWDVATHTYKHSLEKVSTGFPWWGVDSLAYSPDGTTIAGAHYNKVWLWDAKTHKTKHIFDGYNHHDVAYSPDGTTFISGLKVAFSPDGTKIVGPPIYLGTSATLRDVETGRSIKSFRIFDDFTSGKELIVYDVETARVVHLLTFADSYVRDIAYCPDGNMVAAAIGSSVYLWDATIGRLKHRLTDDEDVYENEKFFSVAFSSDGTTLASGDGPSGKGRVRLWDVSTGTLKNTLYGHSRAVVSLAFSPDGQTLASGSHDGTVLFWDMTPSDTTDVTLSTPETSETTGMTDSSEDEVDTPQTPPDDGEIPNIVKANQPITGPWLWMIAPTEPGQGGKTSTDVDSLDALSDGAVTEADVAKNGATEGNMVGNLAWTLGQIAPTGADNINDAVTKIGLGEGNIDHHSAYALITLVSATAQSNVSMQVGSDDSIKVWFNGSVVYTNPINRSSNGFQDTFLVDLVAGDNLLLVKVSENGADWTMFVGVGIDVTVKVPTRLDTPTTPVETEIDNTTVDLSPKTIASPNRGEQITFSLNITSGANVAGYQATLQFDTTALKYIESSNSNYLPSGAFAIPVVAQGKTITLAASSLNGESNGDGTLATITFEVVAVKASTVTLSDVLLTNSAGESFTPQTENAEITKPTHLPEDVNEDGVVNIVDLTLVASNLDQTGANAADVNGDGVVNIVDLTLVAAAFGNTAAAPLALDLYSEIAPTRADIEAWLREARKMNLTDPAFHRGIQMLKQLLAALTPKETALLPNYPNPFNPETWIPYQLAKPADVTVRIYAADGKLVITLALGHQAVGKYYHRIRAAYWDGKNAQGEAAASGVYFYTLTAGDFSATRKMLILK